MMPTFGMSATDLLLDLSHTRVHDLAARRKAGHLTAAESLALAILRGGREGEEGVPAMIDAAQEEYGHGGYRVPVRVVSTWKNCLVVATAAPGESSDVRMQARTALIETLNGLTAGGIEILTMPSGWKLEVYECAAGESGVTVKESAQ